MSDIFTGLLHRWCWQPFLSLFRHRNPALTLKMRNSPFTGENCCWLCTYHIIILSFRQTGRSKQCRPWSEAVLMRVYTVCHSFYNFWMHSRMQKQLCSNFRIITAIISGVPIWSNNFYGIVSSSSLFSSPEPKAHKVNLYTNGPLSVRRCRPHFQTWISLKPVGQSFILASLEWGKGWIRFWGRLDQNTGFHGSRKPPLTCNVENDISTFSQLFLIISFYTCR